MNIDKTDIKASKLLLYFLRLVDPFFALFSVFPHPYQRRYPLLQ